MTQLKTPILALAILATAATATAQHHPTLPADREVTIINNPKDHHGHDSVNVYNIFIENAPRTFHVAGAPRFAIQGAQGKFYLGIGGSAKATMSYDFGNPISSAFNFTTAAIPFDTPAGNGGLTQFSAQASHIFLNIVALPSTRNQIGVYINANFSGPSYGIRVKYAYIRYRGFIAGYNYSLFTDQAASPASIDNEGPNGFAAIHNGVFDYVHTFNPHWSIAAGLEKPVISATASATTSIVSQRVPDIPLYVQYSWARSKGWLRLSALIRNLQYRDLTAAKNVDRLGWGLKLSGSTPLCPFLTAYYQAAYGKGITTYFQDTEDLGLDMTPDPTRPGHLSLVESWGGYLAMQYNISPRLFATTTYSHLRLYTDGNLPADHYKYTQYALANLLWRITPEVTAGIEYIYGRRVNSDNASRHDNRLQAMLQVSF